MENSAPLTQLVTEYVGEFSETLDPIMMGVMENPAKL